jgi:hypothetical protein
LGYENQVLRPLIDVTPFHCAKRIICSCCRCNLFSTLLSTGEVPFESNVRPHAARDSLAPARRRPFMRQLQVNYRYEHVGDKYDIQYTFTLFSTTISFIMGGYPRKFHDPSVDGRFRPEITEFGVGMSPV